MRKAMAASAAGLAWLAVATSAVAAGPQSVRQTAEATMLVTGTVEVNPDGSLHGFAIDQPNKLPAPARQVIDQYIPRWTFTLSGATDEIIKAPMNLRLVAKPTGEGQYAISIASASFGDNRPRDGETVSFKSHSPAPRYPEAAVRSRVSGTAYLMLRIGRDGTVREAIAEQVNLDQYGTQAQMARYRKLFADASIEAARQWTYSVPTRGKSADDPYWVARVPVNFYLRDVGNPAPHRAYGSWQGYIPGPRQSPPWATQTLLSEAPDAVPEGGIDTGDGPLKLATPLTGS